MQQVHATTTCHKYMPQVQVTSSCHKYRSQVHATSTGHKFIPQVQVASIHATSTCHKCRSQVHAIITCHKYMPHKCMPHVQHASRPQHAKKEQAPSSMQETFARIKTRLCLLPFAWMLKTTSNFSENPIQINSFFKKSAK